MSEGNGRDTEPVPKDPEARLSHQIAELELAAYRIGELLSGLNHTLSLLRLAQATEEHRVNKIQDAAEVHGSQLEDHERRLRSLETERAPAAE